MIHRLAAMVAILLLIGCDTTSVAPSARPVAVPAMQEQQQSLFSSDAAVLSDEDIARILSHRYAPPARSRIAIIALAQMSWIHWSDELTRQSEEVRRQVVDQLRASSVVTTASYLPTFLVPEKRTVGLLREAAARYQADLLLIYRTSCRTYERYALMRSDQTKALCSVEAALLDTRTGIVPFTSVVSRDVSAEKKPEDITFEETVRKAELAALADALREIGTRVTGFLETR